jgi:hypothetical protein
MNCPHAEALYLSKIHLNQYPTIYAGISSSLESSQPKFHLYTTRWFKDTVMVEHIKKGKAIPVTGCGGP